jgi:hypothetical protein
MISMTFSQLKVVVRHKNKMIHPRKIRYFTIQIEYFALNQEEI